MGIKVTGHPETRFGVRPITKGLLYRVLGLFTEQNIKHGMVQHAKMLKRLVMFNGTNPVLHPVLRFKTIVLQCPITKTTLRMISESLTVRIQKRRETQLINLRYWYTVQR